MKKLIQLLSMNFVLLALVASCTHELGYEEAKNGEQKVSGVEGKQQEEGLIHADGPCTICECPGFKSKGGFVGGLFSDKCAQVYLVYVDYVDEYGDVYTEKEWRRCGHYDVKHRGSTVLFPW